MHHNGSFEVNENKKFENVEEEQCCSSSNHKTTSDEKKELNDITEPMDNSIQRSFASAMRPDYISWPDFFMGIALLAAQRSKDPATQVGACIVNEDNIILGVGYNGMPRGCPDDLMPWGKNNSNSLYNKYFYVVHAEANAILNSNSPLSLRNTTLYSTLFPCCECAKLIIQSNIKEVVFLRDKSDKQEFEASRKLLDITGVLHRQFCPTRKELVLRFQFE